MIPLLLIITCCILNTSIKSANLHLHEQHYWLHHFTAKMIETALESAKITHCQPMQDYLNTQKKSAQFDNIVQVIFFANGFKGVFKPGADRFAEVAAYRISKFLGLDLVPPTVFRIINEEEGSLQFFIEGAVQFPSQQEKYLALTQTIDHEALIAARLFRFIVGQWDVTPDNQLLHSVFGKKQLALIDNAGIINMQQVQYGDHAYIQCGYSDMRSDDWDQPFPFTSARTLHNTSFAEISVLFNGFISDTFIASIRRYPTIKYCMWRNSLWIQFYADHPYINPNFSSDCPQQLLKKFQHLSYEILAECWKEALHTNEKERIEKLMLLTLERRDQVLHYFKENNESHF